tara:strand:- start:419 stop:592 length:174 start_codon:yes stop_codon:yes gene_type:complete
MSPAEETPLEAPDSGSGSIIQYGIDIYVALRDAFMSLFEALFALLGQSDEPVASTSS